MGSSCLGFLGEQCFQTRLRLSILAGFPANKIFFRRKLGYSPAKALGNAVKKKVRWEVYLWAYAMC